MAEFMFLTRDFLKREIPVNFSKLPAQCCAKCENWVKCDGRFMSESEWSSHLRKFVSGYGCCTINCTPEWDAFTWADDVCDEFSKDTDGEEMNE